MSQQANTNDTVTAVKHTTPLALHSKKSLSNSKSNISLNTPIHNSNNKLNATDKVRHSATSSTLKHPTKCLITAKKSLDLNENSTEAENASSPTSATPFSINNVSNSKSNMQPPIATACLDARPLNLDAKNIDLFKTPLISKTALNTTATVTILKNNSTYANVSSHKSCNNLNDLSQSGLQIKKVNFIIPKSQMFENTSSSTDDNVEKHVASGQQQHFNRPNKVTANIVAKHSQSPGHNVYKQNKHGRNNLFSKNIIYKGTFPIDMPLNSSLNDYDPEANFKRYDLSNYQVFESDSNDEYDDDDEDEDNDVLDDDYGEFLITKQNLETLNHAHHSEHQYKSLASYGIIKAKRKTFSPPMTTQKPPQVWSMQELINDPSIPLNYKKMCNEVEQSLQDFEQFIDSKAHNDKKTLKTVKPPVVHTFNIDDPIDLKKNI